MNGDGQDRMQQAIEPAMHRKTLLGAAELVAMAGPRGPAPGVPRPLELPGPWPSYGPPRIEPPQAHSQVMRMSRCSIPWLNRNASPSASIRHRSAPTRSEGPWGGTISSCTVVPVFNRALVLTFAPCGLMSTELDKYRLVPTVTTTDQATRVRGWCRRSCCRERDMRVTPGNSRAVPRQRGRLLGCGSGDSVPPGRTSAVSRPSRQEGEPA